MAVNAAALTAAAGGLATVVTHLALHAAEPDATGSNQASSGRQAVTWTNTNGALTSGTKSFTGGAASGPCTHVGYWGASSGGTFYGWHAIQGDQTFNAAGEYSLTEATLTVSAT